MALLLFWMGDATYSFGSEHRVFTTNGGGSISGELVAVEGGFVTIKRDDNGQGVKLKADGFCTSDIAYFEAHGLATQSAAASGTAGTGSPTAQPPTRLFQTKSILEGSKWKGNSWALEFDPSGQYHETWYSEHYEGTWSVSSERKVVVTRVDGRVWDFTLSADGDQLVRDKDQAKFALVKPMATAKSIVSGSTWKLHEWVLKFYSTGSYHETWQKHQFNGAWTIEGERKVIVTRTSGEVWKFTLSADGKHLIRDRDGSKFEVGN